MLFSALPARADGPVTLGLGTLTSIALSPDGTRLAVGTTIGVYFYDAQTFAPMGFWMTDYPVGKVLWSPRGNLLVLFQSYPRWGGYRKVIGKLVETGEILWAFEPSDSYGGITATFSPDGAWLLLADSRRVMLYRATDGSQERTLNADSRIGGYNSYSALAFSPDGQRLAVCCSREGLQIWDTATWQLQVVRQTRASQLSWSPDGERLAFVQENWEVSPIVPIWDITGGTIAGAAELGNTDRAKSVAFSPDGKTLAIGTEVGSVMLWSVSSNEANLRQILRGHAASVNTLAWSSDGVLYSAGANTVRAWQVPTGKQLRLLDGFSGQVYQVAWSTDSQHVIDAGAKELVAGDITSLLPIQTASLARSAFAAQWFDPIVDMVVNPTGNVLAVADQTGVSLHDAATLQLAHRLYVGRRIIAVAFSPDGQTVATGGDGAYVTLWDATTGRPRRDLMGSPDSRVILALAFSADGQRLYALESKGVLRQWNLTRCDSTVTPLPELARTSRDYQYYYYVYYAHAAILPSRGRIVIQQNAGLLVLDLATGQRLYFFDAPYPHARAISVSPHGTRVAVVFDMSIKVWNLDSGEFVVDFRGHNDEIADIAFSPDGRSLASGSLDGTVRIWPVP